MKEKSVFYSRGIKKKCATRGRFAVFFRENEPTLSKNDHEPKFLTTSIPSIRNLKVSELKFF